MIDFFVCFIIQNDSFAMIVIAVKHEYSKSKWNRIQIQHQLEFDMPQADKAAHQLIISLKWKSLTVTENLGNMPSVVGCGQENVKLSDQI